MKIFQSNKYKYVSRKRKKELDLFVKEVCDFLEIDPPQNVIYTSTEEKGYYNGNTDTMSISVVNREDSYIITTIVHELRHKWQMIHHREWYLKQDMNTPYEKRPVEIDAEAVARVYIRDVGGVNWGDFSEINGVSPSEKKLLKEVYKQMDKHELNEIPDMLFID